MNTSMHTYTNFSSKTKRTCVYNFTKITINNETRMTILQPYKIFTKYKNYF